MKKDHVKSEPTAEEIDELMPEEGKGKRIANTVINVILVLAIIVAALCTYTSYVSTSGNGVPNVLGIRILSIQTESMYPTMKPGDMIFDTAVKDTTELKIGDVITYWTVIDGERVLNTHRISEIYDGGGYLIFETKGDNNTVADPLTVHESEIIGQWHGAKIGGVGKVFDYLQTSTGFLIVVVIPVAIFFLFHLIQFFRVLFEYNNLKNKLLYEQERGRNEDLVENEKRKIEEARKRERERLEAELREKLKAELLASGAAGQAPSEVKTAQAPEAVQSVEPQLEEAADDQAEAEAKAKAEAEEKAKAEAEAAEKKKAEERAEMEARIRAEMEAEAKAKAEAEAKAKAEAEAAEKRKAEERAEMEARIRAEMEAEAKAKAEAEAAERKRAEERAAMEAEIRAKIKAEMEAEAKAKAGATGQDA